MSVNTLRVSGIGDRGSGIVTCDSRFPIHNSRRPEGFSLIELIISMAILSVGIVGAMRVFPVGLRASERAERSSRAAMVAQRTLESMKLVSWDELAEGQTSQEDEGFTITTRVDHPVIESLIDPTRLKRLEVSVQWVQDRRLRTLTFITYLRHETLSS